MRPVYLIAGILNVALAVIGIILPVMPTVPFLAAAAFCFSRSSPRLHAWILRFPYYGPLIRDWKRYRVVSPFIKWGSVVAIILFFGALILFVHLPVFAKIVWSITAAVMVGFVVTQLETR